MSEPRAYGTPVGTQEPVQATDRHQPGLADPAVRRKMLAAALKAEATATGNKPTNSEKQTDAGGKENVAIVHAAQLLRHRGLQVDEEANRQEQGQTQKMDKVIDDYYKAYPSNDPDVKRMLAARALRRANK